MELMQLRLVFVFVLTRQEQDKTACVAGQAWRRSTSITGPADKKTEQRHLKGPARARRALVASYLVKPGSESQGSRKYQNPTFRVCLRWHPLGQSSRTAQDVQRIQLSSSSTSIRGRFAYASGEAQEKQLCPAQAMRVINAVVLAVPTPLHTVWVRRKR